MTTFISIAFQDESAFVAGKRPVIEIDGPVLIPELGEYVHSSQSMRLEEPIRISGTVVLRTYQYEPNEVHIRLTLKDNYLHV